MSGAQVVDAGGTYAVPSEAQVQEEVMYREMVLRRGLAGQVDSSGGTVAMSPSVQQELIPGWLVTASGEVGRLAFWALESRGDSGLQLWVWSSDGAASWHVEEGFFGPLPVAPGLPWLRVERSAVG